MSSNLAGSAPPLLSRESFLRACSRYATGITVITALDALGQPHGMTANSFTSVSLNPPLILVCVDNRASVFDCLAACSFIGVNILSEQQRGLSVHFASRVEDRFGTIPWYPGETGVPLLQSVLATFECEVRERIPAGDHLILLAEAAAVTYADGDPLLYYASAYRNLRTLE